MTTTTGPSAGEEPLDRALVAASAAVGEAAAAVTWQTGDVAVLGAVRRVAVLRAQVESLFLDLVRQVDDRGLATASPVATTPEGFLRTTCLLDPGQARRDVAAARATAPGEPLAPLGTALAEGRTSRGHVDVAVRCLDAIPSHVLARPGAAARAVAYLQQAADGTGPTGMRRSADQLLARLVPERADRFDPHAHQRRFLDVHTDDTGMVVGSFQLNAVTGATFRTALDQHSAPSVGADGDPDRRIARQRRADALGAVCETALGVAVPRRGERPRIVVLATAEQLAGASAGSASLESGDPLSHAEATRLACDAVLQRVVMDPSAGPLDVGRAHRLVTLAQRRALEARDGGCIIPGCGAKASWCDAHHLVAWSVGGPTDLCNLCLLCPAHHTAVHAGAWRVHLQDGQLLVTPPRWVDPTRTPRPVRHHVLRRAVDDLDLDLSPDPDPDRQLNPVHVDLRSPAGPVVTPQPHGPPRAAPPGRATPPWQTHRVHQVPYDVALRSDRAGRLLTLPVAPATHVDLSVEPLVALLQALLDEQAPGAP